MELNRMYCKWVFEKARSTSLHTANHRHDGWGRYPITGLSQSVYVMCHDISGLLLWLIKHLWIGQCYRKHILVRPARLHTGNGANSPSWEIQLTEDNCCWSGHRTKPTLSLRLRPTLHTPTQSWIHAHTRTCREGTREPLVPFRPGPPGS